MRGKGRRKGGWRVEREGGKRESQASWWCRHNLQIFRTCLLV